MRHCQRGCHKSFPSFKACDTDAQQCVLTVEGNAMTSGDQHPEDQPLVTGPYSLSYTFAVISGSTGTSFLNKKYQSIIITLKMYFSIGIAVLMNTPLSLLHNKTIAIM